MVCLDGAAAEFESHPPGKAPGMFGACPAPARKCNRGRDDVGEPFLGDSADWPNRSCPARQTVRRPRPRVDEPIKSRVLRGRCEHVEPESLASVPDHAVISNSRTADGRWAAL